MARKRHKNKHIEAAIEYALERGWRLETERGHWGRLLCPCRRRGACIVRVDGTPRNPESHATKIIRKIDACECEPNDEATETT
jgi:hypothetical protein